MALEGVQGGMRCVLENLVNDPSVENGSSTTIASREWPPKRIFQGKPHPTVNISTED